MSAIRPPVPSPLFPNAPTPSPVRAARSDFFRAALDGVRTPTVAAESKADTPVATAQPPRFTPSPDQPSRPGSLLDIRV